MEKLLLCVCRLWDFLENRSRRIVGRKISGLVLLQKKSRDFNYYYFYCSTSIQHSLSHHHLPKSTEMKFFLQVIVVAQCISIIYCTKYEQWKYQCRSCDEICMNDCEQFCGTSQNIREYDCSVSESITSLLIRHRKSMNLQMLLQSAVALSLKLYLFKIY